MVFEKFINNRKLKNYFLSLILVIGSFFVLSAVFHQKVFADCYRSSAGVSTGVCNNPDPVGAIFGASVAQCDATTGSNGTVGLSYFYNSSGNNAVSITNHGSATIDIGTVVCNGPAAANVTEDNTNFLCNYVWFGQPPCSSNTGVLTLTDSGVGTAYGGYITTQPPCSVGTPICQDMGPIAPGGWAYKELSVTVNGSLLPNGGDISIAIDGSGTVCNGPGGTSCGETNPIVYTMSLHVTVDNFPPNVIGSIDCTAQTVTVSASDGDWGKAVNPNPAPEFNGGKFYPDWVSYSINGGPIQWTDQQNFSINMSAYVQNGTYSVLVTAYDIDSDGQLAFYWKPPPGTVNPNIGGIIDPKSIPYGPCPVKPYLSVTGGDVVSGSDFNASGGSCTDTKVAMLLGGQPPGIVTWNSYIPIAGPFIGSGGFAGAGDNLAAQALGTINGFATDQPPEGGYYNGTTVGTDGPPFGLSFANVGTDGNFGAAPCPPNIPVPTAHTTLLPPDVTKPSPCYGGRDWLDVSKLGTATYPGQAFTYNNTGKTLYLTTSGIPGNCQSIPMLYVAGQKAKLFITGGTVVILESIKYNFIGVPAAGTPADLPSFELIANDSNIIIDPAVSNLDGLYMATPDPVDLTKNGIIETCSVFFNGNYVFAGVAPCKNQLIVTGSFVASQVYFERTYGSSTLVQTSPPTPIAPAEQFNYDPEMWLGQSSPATGAEPYDSVTGLPPVL